MKKDMIRQSVVALSILATIAINGLANVLPFNGQLTGEISDRYPVFFVPAGYVFSIWGLIYLGLIAYAIYQGLPSQRLNPALQRTGYLVVGSGIANSVWIFLWHYEFFPLTLVAMIVLLLLLVAVYLRLDIGRWQVSVAERWLVHAPFSIYLGWVTVATIANVTSLLYILGWRGGPLSGQVWAVLLLVAGVIIAGLMSHTRRDVAYLGVLIWAFVGIAMKQTGDPLVSISAWIAAGLVLATVIYAFLAGKRPVPIKA